MNELTELLPYWAFIVAAAIAIVVGTWWRRKNKTAAEAQMPVAEVADAIGDAAIAEAEARDPKGRWTKILKWLRTLGAIAIFTVSMYGCTALTAATDAYKAVTGAQDTVVHVHRFDTVRVKIYERDSVRCD